MKNFVKGFLLGLFFAPISLPYYITASNADYPDGYDREMAFEVGGSIIGGIVAVLVIFKIILPWYS